MDSIGFYFFCLAIGYVIVWFLVNERRGNENGEWGLLAIRQPSEPTQREVEGTSDSKSKSGPSSPGNWRP